MRNLHLTRISHYGFDELLSFQIARNQILVLRECFGGQILELLFVWQGLYSLFEQRPGITAVSTFNSIKGVGILFRLLVLIIHFIETSLFFENNSLSVTFREGRASISPNPTLRRQINP